MTKTTPRRPGRPTTLPEPWLSLARALGGVAELAAAAGVSTRAIQRYATEERAPSLAQRKLLNGLARRRGIAAPWPGDS